MAYLSLIVSGSERLRFPLSRFRTAVGGSGVNDIVVPGGDVPELLFTIAMQKDRGFLAEAAGGGLVVNSGRIESRRLEDGDEIRAGAVSLVFRFGGEPASPRPAGPPEASTGVLSYSPGSNALRLSTGRLSLPDGSHVDVSKPTFTIGKAAGNDLVLADSFVSSFHCIVFLRHGRFMVRDLQSTNGTRINGVPVMEAELPFNATLTAGRTDITFRARPHDEKLVPADERLFMGMVGGGPAMRRVFALLRKVAAADTPVIILGETGTGKELAARAIHALGGRSEAPFVAINCAALSRELLESELFGHERGAFTGAVTARQGAFEEAGAGTLLLDEIGELPLDLQAKLLRAIETGEFRRVGGRGSIRAAARIVTATNRDLRAMAGRGEFREDLFYRIHVLPVTLPPLRERPEDIRAIALHFASQLSPAGAKIEISAAALRKLDAYGWPGNVRELRNVIARAILLAEGSTLSENDVQILLMPRQPCRIAEVSAAPYAAGGGRSLEQTERDAVLDALRRSGWNRNRAAEALGIARSTLFKKIDEHGLRDIEARERNALDKKAPNL